MRVLRVSHYEEEWDNFARQSDMGSVYHLYAWREIFGRSFGFDSFYLKVINSYGEVKALQPIFLVNNFLQKKLVSVPFRDRGGPLWKDEQALVTILAEVNALAIFTGASMVEIKSPTPLPREIINQFNFIEKKYWIQSVVAITFTKDELWKAIGPKTRNMIRQGERESLAFEEDTSYQDPVSEFYTIFLETQKKLGIPSFPKGFFSVMYDRLKENQNIKLFFVTRNEKPVGATILLLFGETAIYAYSASLKDALSARVNDFMMWNTFCWLIERGYQIFDLGSDSPLQNGLLFFKKKWLAEQRPLPFYYHFPGRKKSVHQMDSSLKRYAVYRKIFSILPRPAFRSLGGFITRYLG